MLKKYMAILVIALGVAPLFADVELQTSINDVYYRGTAELAGSITMTVNDDDFTNASTSEPVFIRVTPDHRSKLAETLVDQSLNAGTFTAGNPIFLATELVGTGDSSAFWMTADPETVSIVRWVAGENEFWLRIQSDSDEWIGSPGGPRGPNEELKVSWTLGVSARSSADDNTSWGAVPGPGVKSNLPFNTRISATDGTTDDASSTLLCVNLAESNLTTDGEESRLQYDIIAFDENAEVDTDDGVYSAQEGSDAGINFTNDFIIARGRNRLCEVDLNAFKNQAAASTLLCVPAAVGNDSINGFVSMCNVIRFDITCFQFDDELGTLLDTDLFDNSYLEFDTGNRGDYGFRYSSDAEFGTVDADGEFETILDNGFTDRSGYFTDNGLTLASEIALFWDGGLSQLQAELGLVETLTARVCVWYYYDNAATDVVLDWRVVLVNHDGAQDDRDEDGDGLLEFGGDDQNRRCEPSDYEVYVDTWDFGSFLPCQGDTVSLFFPYVPKFAGDTGFWVGVSYVNQGNVDFQDDGIEAIFYSENGDRFSTTMPGLPIQNQMTWVLTAAGLTGAGDNNDGDTRVPQPTDPAVPADSFGDTRMSMFLTGDFEAEFEDDVASGDLDGYMLIGNSVTNSVDGAYLPRNYDNSVENQDADMPIRRSKKAAGKHTGVQSTPARITTILNRIK